MRSNRMSGLWLLVLMFLVSCQLKSEYMVSSSASVATSCPSRPESSRTHSDLLLSTPSTTTEAVAALAFASDGQTLWLAFSREPTGQGGELVHIRLADWQVLHAFELDALNERFTQFNGDATLLVTFRRDWWTPPPAYSRYPPIPIYDLKAWQTATGELIPGEKYTAAVEDFGLAKKGKWVIAVRQAAIDILDPTKPSSRRALGIGFDTVELLLTGATNDSGDLIAYGTDAQHVWIDTWDGKSLEDAYVLEFGPIRKELWLQVNLEHKPIKLAIAPNNKWLAVQSEEVLELRDMYSGFFPQQAQVTLPRTSNGILQFSPSAKFLAVGHSQGLRVYTVPDLKTVVDKPGSQTTAIAFSPDGCLLAWGDTDGTVHIVNAPKP